MLGHSTGAWRPDASEHRPDLPSLQARVIAGILAWPIRIGKLLVCGYIQRDPLYEVVRVVWILDMPEPIARDGPGVVTRAHAHIWRQTDGPQTQSVLDGVDVDAQMAYLPQLWYIRLSVRMYWILCHAHAR